MKFAKVVHVIPAISEEASGPSYSVTRLVESLIGNESDAALAVLDWAPMDNPAPYLRRFPLGVGPRRLWEVTGDAPLASPCCGIWGSGHCSQSRDVAGQFAISGMGVRENDGASVISPRGALSSWAMSHGSFLKRLFWPWLQRPALNSAACFHATSLAEYEDIRRAGFKQPVAVIPNGIDVPSRLPKEKSEFRTLLFLGRIHPVKGLDLLISAWDESPACIPRLAIADCWLRCRVSRHNRVPCEIEVGSCAP